MDPLPWPLRVALLCWRLAEDVSGDLLWRTYARNPYINHGSKINSRHRYPQIQPDAKQCFSFTTYSTWPKIAPHREPRRLLVSWDTNKLLDIHILVCLLSEPTPHSRSLWGLPIPREISQYHMELLVIGNGSPTPWLK